MIKIFYGLTLTLLILAERVAVCGAGSIVFSPEDFVTSSDFASAFERYRPSLLENPSQYKLPSNTFLIQRMTLPLANSRPLTLLLVSVGKQDVDWCTDIQLLLVKDLDGGGVSVQQRFKLGAGEWPHLLTPSDRLPSDEFMVQVMRRENNVEAYVYSADSLTGKLTQTFRVDRAFLSRTKTELKGLLVAGGFVDVVAQNPTKSEKLDLSAAIDALIDDELYQSNGRPVPSLVNLNAVRTGSEGVEIYKTDNSTELHVGLSLVTLSKKRVVDATAIVVRDANDRWTVRDVVFEPFLPYRAR